VERIDTFADPGDDGYGDRFLEYDPVADQVWVAYERINPAASLTKIYDVGTDTTSTFLASEHGELRCCRELGVMLWYSGTSLRIYELGTGHALLRTITVPANLKLWTWRYLDRQVCVLYVLNNSTRLLVLDADSWTTLGDYEIAQSSASPHLLTVFTQADGADVGIGYGGGRYFVLARYFAGIIPYADFEGMSCGAALRELAVAAAAVLEVDEYKVGRIRGRSFLLSPETTVELGDPLEQQSMPVWEDFRSSVVVTGESESGDEIEVTQGETGDSSHRLEISSKFVTTEGLATAIAALYHAFYGVVRAQESVTVEEPFDRVRPFRTVSLGGRTYLVLEAETELMDRTQQLRLVEV
jgi:hypothetical protein